MSSDTDVSFELRSGDGVTILEAGKRTKEGEILVNRRNAERLFERRPGMAEFEEIGAHAEGAVATERPNLKAEDLNLAMDSGCACGIGVQCECETRTEMVNRLVSAAARNNPPQTQLKFGDAPGEYGQYKALSPEPISIIHSWGMGFNEGSMLEKLARWQTMHNILDLEKLVWFAVDLLEQERIKQNNL